MQIDKISLIANIIKVKGLKHLGPIRLNIREVDCQDIRLESVDVTNVPYKRQETFKIEGLVPFIYIIINVRHILEEETFKEDGFQDRQVRYETVVNIVQANSIRIGFVAHKKPFCAHIFKRLNKGQNKGQILYVANIII